MSQYPSGGYQQPNRRPPLGPGKIVLIVLACLLAALAVGVGSTYLLRKTVDVLKARRKGEEPPIAATVQPHTPTPPPTVAPAPEVADPAEAAQELERYGASLDTLYGRTFTGTIEMQREDGYDYPHFYAGDIPAGPAAYDVFDYDGDDQAELLVVSFDGEGTLQLSMYEYADGAPVLTAEYASDDIRYCDGVAAKDTAQCFTDVFRSGKPEDGVRILADSYGVHNLIADGVRRCFLSLAYTGDAFVVEAEGSIAGSDGLEEESEYSRALARCGIEVSRYLWEGFSLSSYFEDVCFIERAEATFLADHNDVWTMKAGDDPLPASELHFYNKGELENLLKRSGELPQSSTSLFADIAGLYYFSSGVGGWATELELLPDGSFTGQFHDSDMGDTGKNYPNGTMYLCSFSGRFKDPVQLGFYTWSFTLDELGWDKLIGEEEIIDGVRYVYAEPYGLEESKNFQVFLPGVPIDDLPEDFMTWASLGLYDDPDTAMLPFCGIYNADKGYGFIGEKE